MVRAYFGSMERLKVIKNVLTCDEGDWNLLRWKKNSEISLYFYLVIKQWRDVEYFTICSWRSQEKIRKLSGLFLYFHRNISDRSWSANMFINLNNLDYEKLVTRWHHPNLNAKEILSEWHYLSHKRLKIVDCKLWRRNRGPDFKNIATITLDHCTRF